MQIFEFGPRRRVVNRQGQEIEVSQFALHVQCRWRMLHRSKILFGGDDLDYPADETMSLDDFDWDTHESALDVKRRRWFAEHYDLPVHVVSVSGDDCGGFRIMLERGFALEAFPCDSRRGEYSEHWRLLGHRPDDSHFVVTGYGVEGEDRQSASDG